MTARTLIICVLMGLVAACDSNTPVPTPIPQINENKPIYVKDVVAIDDGDQGILLYFALGDENRGITTADGKAVVEITEGRQYSLAPLYSATLNVKKSDFKPVGEGIPDAEHGAIMYHVGRIPYSSFTRPPLVTMGRVSVKFEPSTGGLLGKEENVFFSRP